MNNGHNELNKAVFILFKITITISCKLKEETIPRNIVTIGGGESRTYYF